MTDRNRPSCIAHWAEVEKPEEGHYRGDDELMGFGAPLARHFGLTRLGIHHERLPPGRRTSFPHAESAEEEFVYVIEGTPEAWLDGEVYPLKPGDSVGFPAGTGLAHTFINNTDAEVRLLVVGEASTHANRIVYPKHLDMKPIRSDWWDDAPVRPLGPHDGMPDAVRAEKTARKAAKEDPSE
ncbi:cupin domain-containing protein [Neorhizobium tomejilense]|uniref:cupin domain-containing protein n=1 Tax=Neorhizobium tomejilense TaxID=2093828 RepID=UPI003ED110C1